MDNKTGLLAISVIAVVGFWLVGRLIERANPDNDRAQKKENRYRRESNNLSEKFVEISDLKPTNLRADEDDPVTKERDKADVKHCSRSILDTKIAGHIKTTFFGGLQGYIVSIILFIVFEGAGFRISDNDDFSLLLIGAAWNGVFLAFLYALLDNKDSVIGLNFWIGIIFILGILVLSQIVIIFALGPILTLLSLIYAEWIFEKFLEWIGPFHLSGVIMGALISNFKKHIK